MHRRHAASEKLCVILTWRRYLAALPLRATSWPQCSAAELHLCPNRRLSYFVEALVWQRLFALSKPISPHWQLMR